ncbi:hypothetical protein CsSME_00004942 [Camellia sinensis var. sinensis]
MALNLSHNSVFPSNGLEGNLFSSIKFGNNGYLMEGCTDKNWAGFGDYMNFNWKLEDEKDILDLLPSDPFGMDLSTTFTAITGWLEDIENDLGLNSIGFGTDRFEVERGEEDRLLAGLNLVWDDALKLHSDVNDLKIQEASIGSGKELWSGLCDGDDNMDELMGFSYEKNWALGVAANEFQGCSEIHSYGDRGAPHDALFFSLGYLGVRDLLSVERVCKSLRDAVQNDPLIWRSVHIDQPLSDRITDDALLRLTSRAQGTLQCLSLVGCLKITDSGLMHVLENNTGLTKVCLFVCLFVFFLSELTLFMP